MSDSNDLTDLIRTGIRCPHCGCFLEESYEPVCGRCGCIFAEDKEGLTIISVNFMSRDWEGKDWDDPCVKDHCRLGCRDFTDPVVTHPWSELVVDEAAFSAYLERIHEMGGYFVAEI